MPHIYYYVPLSTTYLRLVKCDCRMLMHYLLLVLQEAKYLGIPQENNERINCLKYLVDALYPFLKTFIHDQTMEKEMEASIRGIMCTTLFLYLK